MRWSIQTRSPGAFMSSFLIEEYFPFVRHDRFFCRANKHEGQRKFQSLRALNFDGSKPLLTKRFIFVLGKWSRTSCHHIHNCWRGVKTSGFIIAFKSSRERVDATSRMVRASVGIANESGVSTNSICSLVVVSFLSSWNSIVKVVGWEGSERSISIRVPTSMWSFLMYRTEHPIDRTGGGGIDASWTTLYLESSSSSTTSF